MPRSRNDSTALASSRTLRAGFAGAAGGLLDDACARRSGGRQVGTTGWPLRSNNRHRIRCLGAVSAGCARSEGEAARAGTWEEVARVVEEAQQVSTGKSARAPQTRKPADANSDFLDALTQENGCGLFCGCQCACRLRTSCRANKLNLCPLDTLFSSFWAHLKHPNGLPRNSRDAHLVRTCS
jgi:hypothetical protein